MQSVERRTEHLTADQLAAYLDRALEASEQRQVEGHLADCHQCTAELLAVGRVLRSHRGRRWWYVGPPLAAAAAAAAILFLVVNPISRPEAGGPPLRGVGEPARAGALQVSAILPLSGGVVQRGALTFVWGAAAPDARYHVTLTDALANEIWSGDTSDTLLVLPESVSLDPGATYLWYVDALLLDGQSATTRAQSFTVAQ